MRVLLSLMLSILTPHQATPTADQIQGAAVLVDLDQRAIAGDTDAAQALIRVVFPEDQQWALMVARRESGLRCNARNPRSSASGLFQLMGIHAGRAKDMGLTWNQVQTSCLANLVVARAMYEDSGHQPWAL